jgi:hypothetical protein
MYFIKNVADWKIVWDDISKYLRKIDNWIVSIEIKKYWNRNLEQNKKYWKILSIWAKQLNYNPDELHYFFKFKILGEQDWLPSSKELNVAEFSRYLELVINMLSEMGVVFVEDLFD